MISKNYILVSLQTIENSIPLMSEQHKEQTDKMTKLEIELQGRVGVLEKWRWIIIGGSIVAGFIIQKMLVL